MQEIVVPVDGSESAGHAARFGAFLAKETGAKLTLLHVFDAQMASLLGLARESKEEVQTRAQHVAEGSFSKARTEIRDFGVRTEEITRLGHPAAQIVEYAREQHPQLIVMGSRGLSHWREIWLGSVSDQVVRIAPCPVTIVR